MIENERKIAFQLDDSMSETSKMSEENKNKSDISNLFSLLDAPQSIDLSHAKDSSSIISSSETLKAFEALEASEELGASEALNTSEKSETSKEPEVLKERIISALKEIYDPEIPVNIYDLGLIYAVEVDASHYVSIKMTLTSPMCPVAQTFPQTVQDRILQVANVASVTVDLVWDPPWTKENMTEEVRLHLNLF